MAEWDLSPEDAERVDRACDRFEREWQTGTSPSLAAFAEQVNTPVGQVLLGELLRIELTYRRQRGESPSPETYVARFPGHAERIAAIFEELATQPVPPAKTEPQSAFWACTTIDDTAGIDRDAWPNIPSYEIVEELGRGAMGIVYKAWQQNARRHVALKVIRDGVLAVEQHRKRFRKEAESAARFDHPNLVHIYDVGEHQGLLYFSMRLGEHGSLEKRLARQPWPAVKAAELTRTLADAIQYAHEKNVIHRDLKPANIVLTQDERPLITDFGLAKRLDSDSATTLTNLVMGTAAYMPPEQARGDAKHVGPTADVYSLGAILYEMLTGQPPFRAATLEALLQLVLYQEPPPPRTLRPDVPADLEAICLKCLEKEPEQRYASAQVFADDLRRFLAGEAPSVTPLTEWDRQARWARQAGYEVLDFLGGGRYFGIVHKARQVRLNRIVILKTVEIRAQRDPQEIERFHHSAEVLAQLQHPNIVQVYDFGEHNGRAFIAMEHVEGGTLADKLLETPWPVRQAVELVATLARAVHYAHQRGVIHCALRPFNILLTTESVPKITNFGLDWLLEAVHDNTDQMRLVPHHVTNYMAPEQTLGRRGVVGPAIDVYALGAILYELLTGRVPIEADGLKELFRRVRQMQPLQPSHWQADLPRNLDAICLKCLNKVPAERYGSAGELAQVLQRFLTGDQQKTEEVELIPGYAFEEELGRGGTGIVYKARQINLDRSVALKIFYASVPSATLLHIRSASRAMAQLQHPNLVQVYDCGERDGLLYVAEELVEGVTLEKKCLGAPQAPGETAGLVETLARAMDFAHQRGIFHCNLKPKVVLMASGDIPKISSFEAAKLLGQQDPEAGREATLVVTPTYMAPEQAAGNADQIGPATDVYTLGNLLYELLTGRPPFQSTRLGELLEQIRSQAPLPPRQLVPAVPIDLERICLKCLQKQPGERYANPARLAEALSRVRAGKPLLGDEVSEPGIWARWLRWLLMRRGKTHD
jgi:serine/threonine protein kinase